MRAKAVELAKLIRDRRVELGLSQYEVTAALGYNPKTSQFVSNIELGKCSLPPAKINALSLCLDLPRIKIFQAMVKDYEEGIMLVANAPIVYNQ